MSLVWKQQGNAAVYQKLRADWTGEGLPRAVANIAPEILEKSQTEGCNGGK